MTDSYVREARWRRTAQLWRMSRDEFAKYRERLADGDEYPASRQAEFAAKVRMWLWRLQVRSLLDAIEKRQLQVELDNCMSTFRDMMEALSSSTMRVA